MRTHCYYCERKFGEGYNHPLRQTRDHIIAKAQGGNGNPKNIVLACYECNILKGSLSLEDFFLKISGRKERLKAIKDSRCNIDFYSRMQLNVQALIERIEPYRHELLKGFNYSVSPTIAPKKKEGRPRTLVGDYLERHKEFLALAKKQESQRRQTEEEALFLQSQTVEQFAELNKKPAIRQDRADGKITSVKDYFKEVLSEPEPNFHYL